jgi:hypothetical protein
MPFFSVNDFQIPQDRQVYFDANIWLTLYGPETLLDKHQRRRVDVYEKLFCTIVTRGIIFTSQVVLSEFINRTARFEYELCFDSSSRGSFKNYRKSPQFRAVAKSIQANVKKILRDASLAEEPLFVDTDQLWAGFSSGIFDFNDYSIYQICRRHNYILVTDDGDMRFPDIDILTENERLLR